MKNLKVLNIDVNTAYGKSNLDITDMRYDLRNELWEFDNTQVDIITFEVDSITFGDLTLTKEMEKDLEKELMDVLNKELHEKFQLEFDDYLEAESILDDFLDDRHNIALYDIKEHAEELLENEIKEEAKDFLIGVLETIDDGEESLIDYFHERKDGGYYLELSMFFRTDTRHVIAEFDSCSLARGTYSPIVEAIIEFDYELN